MQGCGNGLVLRFIRRKSVRLEQRYRAQRSMVDRYTRVIVGLMPADTVNASDGWKISFSILMGWPQRNVARVNDSLRAQRKIAMQRLQDLRDRAIGEGGVAASKGDDVSA
jgi:hypothetical protein